MVENGESMPSMMGQVLKDAHENTSAPGEWQKRDETE